MKRGIVVAVVLLCTAAGAEKAVSIVRNSKVLEFSYEWPAEAATIPTLDRKFRIDLRKAYREALPLARENHLQYETEGRGAVRDLYSMKWTVAGETPRLLSLESQESTYTGGAHPNTRYNALLWDRKLGRQITVMSLFLRASSMPALTRSTYCALLNRERSIRRNGEKMGVREFEECPSYSYLAISPSDSDKDGRFDVINFVAGPYGAGPYVEGEYDIPVPVSARLIAALKPQYRGSFEVQRQ